MDSPLSPSHAEGVIPPKPPKILDSKPFINELIQLDHNHVWHPYASTKLAFPPYFVLSAEGAYLELSDGDTRYHVVDGMASWWCAIHGYRNPVMDNAITTQIQKYAHVMFGGLTHEPAIQLCSELAELSGFDRVFLADSGSVAMEVALKLARQVQMARKGINPETLATSKLKGCALPQKFAALRGGYHGDTWGVMSVCDPDMGMHSLYGGALPAQIFLPRPPAKNAESAEIASWCQEVQKTIEKHRQELIGIVVEPLLQGAGGMWVWAVEALRYLRQLCDEYDLLLLADEIATGFGRTGRLFACEWAEVKPDIMAVGKALTGGYLTQSAMLTSNQIVSELEANNSSVLMHGPTFMANPLASAASLASLSLIKSGYWQTSVPMIEKIFTQELASLQDNPLVADIRIFGAAAAVELTQTVDMPLATVTAIRNGAWLRPFGKVVYSLPPYICTADDIRIIAKAICAVVAAHTKELS